MGLRSLQRYKLFLYKQTQNRPPIIHTPQGESLRHCISKGSAQQCNRKNLIISLKSPPPIIGYSGVSYCIFIEWNHNYLCFSPSVQNPFLQPLTIPKKEEIATPSPCLLAASDCVGLQLSLLVQQSGDRCALGGLVGPVGVEPFSAVPVL